MDKIVTEKTQVNSEALRGDGNNKNTNITVVETNGTTSMVILKDTGEIMPSVGNNLQTGSTPALRPQPQGLTISDVGFTSLLSKHLYSTTMTRASSQTTELRPDVIKSTDITTNITSEPSQAPLVMLPQNQINVLPSDLLQMSSLFNNPNIMMGNGQNLPQIIYVPVIAAPPVANGESTSNTASVSPINPLNYGMISALPLTSTASNLNNIVYVQPPPQQINPGQQQLVSSVPSPSTLTSTAAASAAAALLSLVQSQSTSLLNLAAAAAAQQPQQTPLVSLPPATQQAPLVNLAAVTQQQTPLVSLPPSTQPQAPLVNLPAVTQLQTPVVNLPPVTVQQTPLVSLPPAAVQQTPLASLPTPLVNIPGVTQPLVSLPQSPVVSLPSVSQSPLLNFALNQALSASTLQGHQVANIGVKTSNVPNSTVVTSVPAPKKAHKRKLSRNKSISSDTSSLDSSNVDGLSSPTGHVKQTSVPGKKIERVRKTMNTEEELNSKVSGLVSKIMSQFPQRQSTGAAPPPPPAQTTNRPRYPAKKRNKQSKVTLPNALDHNDSVPNSMIPSTVVLAGEESATENNLSSNDESETTLPQQNILANFNELRSRYVNQNGSNTSSSISRTPLSNNAQNINSASVTGEKVLVSRIELSSILSSGEEEQESALNTGVSSAGLSMEHPGVMVVSSAGLSIGQPGVMRVSSAGLSSGQPGVMGMSSAGLSTEHPGVIGVSSAVLSDSGIIIRTDQSDTALILPPPTGGESEHPAAPDNNPTIILQSVNDEGNVIIGSVTDSNRPAVIVQSAPGQIPLEYVQIGPGENNQQSFMVEQLPVRTDN